MSTWISLQRKTPVRDAYVEKQQGMNRDEVFKGSKGLSIGDYIRTETDSMGFVTKVNPKTVLYETLYGGYGDNDTVLMELKTDKNKIKQYLKPKP